MPRKTIPLVTGEKYHVFNRGVDKRDLFLSPNDKMRFYRCMSAFNSNDPVISFRQAARHDVSSNPLVRIHAYALLTNHFHLLVEQLVDGGLSEYMKRLSAGYACYFNEKYERSGTLFQGTFKRSHIDCDEYYNYVFTYVNENHTVHGFAGDRELYESSSVHYQGLRKSILINSKREYSVDEATKLAKSIYQRRKQFKNLLLE